MALLHNSAAGSKWQPQVIDDAGLHPSSGIALASAAFLIAAEIGWWNLARLAARPLSRNLVHTKDFADMP